VRRLNSRRRDRVGGRAYPIAVGVR